MCIALSRSETRSKHAAFMGPRYKSVIKMVKQKAVTPEISVVPDPDSVNQKYSPETPKTMLPSAATKRHCLHV